MNRDIAMGLVQRFIGTGIRAFGALAGDERLRSIGATEIMVGRARFKRGLSALPLLAPPGSGPVDEVHP